MGSQQQAARAPDPGDAPGVGLLNRIEITQLIDFDGRHKRTLLPNTRFRSTPQVHGTVYEQEVRSVVYSCCYS